MRRHTLVTGRLLRAPALSRAPALPRISRSVYIAANKQPRKEPESPALPLADVSQLLQQLDSDNADVDKKIKQIDAYTSAIRRYIKEKDEEKRQKRVVDQLKLDTAEPAPAEDIDILDTFITSEVPAQMKRTVGGVGLFASPAASVKLPPAFHERLGNSLIHISASSPRDQNWAAIISTLRSNEGFQRLSSPDVDQFISCIPLDQRANGLMPIILEMMDEAGIQSTKLTFDHAMAAYAHKGQTVVVEAFRDQLLASGFSPDAYTYGHLAKCYGKNSDVRNCSAILSVMKDQNITPTLPIYTTILQTCIRVKDYDEAFKIFDLLKYMSLETLPDVIVYNSLMLAAAKQYNIERVLDLYREMTTRPSEPLEPNADTYNILIFACARDKRTHLNAWKSLLEMQQKGFDIDRKAINSLMYLCGESGELFFARQMFRQLSTTAISYPDAMVFNSLLKAYGNYEPGVFSPVMASPMGAKIRSGFFFQDEMSMPATKHVNEFMPPLLPVTMLHSSQQVLAESQALLSFFRDKRPSMLNENIILTYLTIPVKLKDFEEFRRRFQSETYYNQASSSNKRGIVIQDASNEHTSTAVPRNWRIYDMAIRACSDFKALDFANELWIERGSWRNTKQFRDLPEKLRKHSDFSFARGMVALLANCGEIDQAIKLIRSTVKLFKWKKYMIPELVDKVTQLEDDESAREIRYLLFESRK